MNGGSFPLVQKGMNTTFNEANHSMVAFVENHDLNVLFGDMVVVE